MQLLQEIKDLAGKFKMNDAATSYYYALDRCVAEAGERGAVMQIPYILNNVKAMTPEQKEAKKKLQAIYKREYLDK